VQRRANPGSRRLAPDVTQVVRSQIVGGDMDRESFKVTWRWCEVIPDDRGWGWISTDPGVYRITFGGPRPACYIGETENLRARMRSHRTGRGNPRTRLADRWFATDGDGLLVVEIADDIFMNRWKVNDLSIKLNRVMVESVAIVKELRQGMTQVINKGHFEY